MDPAFPNEEFAAACHKGDEPGLAELLARLGFGEPKKSAVNLLLLKEQVPEIELLVKLTINARGCADPDQALNALERLASNPKTTALGPVLADEHLRSILLTVLGASRFLANILYRHPELLAALFRAESFEKPRNEEALLEELRRLVSDQASFDDLLRHLRLFKQQEILRIAARDLSGLADLATTTAELSDLAAACLQRAYEVCDALLRAQYGSPLTGSPGDGNRVEAEFTVLGMGKFGGRELNFSSDIDLIYCYSREDGETTGIRDATGHYGRRLPLHQYFVKLAESITKAMHQVTADGFVFRVDLRLRPEGRSGEIAISRAATESYYENWARSWERSAMLKARPVAGSRSLGTDLLRTLEPFIYRRFLDYTMIEDLKVMKQKIDRNLTREREGELNLKLGRGGIREIEFFIQAMQLIHAGKHPLLREKNSLRALSLLQSEGLIDAETFDILTKAYSFLRNVEHRIQVVEERQTHNLPVDSTEFLQLARRCGFDGEAGFREALEEYRQAVSGIYRDLFYTSEEEAREEEVTAEIAAMLDEGSDPDLVRELFQKSGFANPDQAYENLLLLRHGAAYGHMGQQARRHLDRIAPLLLKEVIGSPEPGMAFTNLIAFLGALRARASFFALLAENRQIAELLISLFGTSQFLSRSFIQHPETLDYLVYGGNALQLKDRTDLRRDLEGQLQRAADIEGRLDLLRRFRNEEFLRIALNDMRGELQFGKGAEQLTLLAEVCLEKALDLARSEMLPRFGLPFCGSSDGEERETAFAILGMGSLGGRELNYHSDLDIIFVYEDDGQTLPQPGFDAETFKPLTNQEYFARLGQKIISILSLITREGYVYKIDTRLRPSGNRGPLVTSFEAYRQHHEKSGRLWERQALIKARVVAGPEEFARQIENLTEEIVYEKPLPADYRNDIRHLRQELAKRQARKSLPEGNYNIKTGRGGMLDVEVLVQYLQLLHGCTEPALRGSNTLEMLDAVRGKDLIENEEYVSLANGYRFLRRMENRLRLIHDQSTDQFFGARGKLARSLGYGGDDPGQQLLDHFHRITDGIRTVFDRYLGGQRDQA